MTDPAAMEEIREEDLHAYVDGSLPARRRAALEGLLATDPDLALRAESYRRINVDLHAVCDSAELHVLPPSLARLGRELDSNLRHQRVLHRIIRAAASLGVAAAVAIGAWWGYAHVLAPPDPLVAFTRQAIDAYLLLADGAAPTGPEAWLAERLDGPAAVRPDLAGFGLSLVDERMLPSNLGAAVQMLYRDAEGRSVTLYLGADRNRRRTSFSFAQTRDISQFSWRSAGIAYSLVGRMDRDRLLEIARAVSDALTPHAGAVVERLPLGETPAAGPDGAAADPVPEVQLDGDGAAGGSAPAASPLEAASPAET